MQFSAQHLASVLRLLEESLVGLDIGSSSVKAVELSMKGKNKGFELTQPRRRGRSPEAIVQGVFLNSSAIVDAIREAVEQRKIKTKEVAAAVSGHSVIVKKVSLPTMTRDELEDQIQWEAEQYIPFDVNEVNLDFQILDTSDGGRPDGRPAGRRQEGPDRRLRAGDHRGRAHARPAWTSRPSRSRTPSRPTTTPSPEEVVALVNVGRAGREHQHRRRTGCPAFTRDITDRRQPVHRRDPEGAVGQLRRGRAHQDGRLRASDGGQEVVPQEVEAGDPLGHRHGGGRDRSLARLLHRHEHGDRAHRRRCCLAGGGARMAGFDTVFHERTGIEVEILNPLARMLPSKGFDPGLSWMRWDRRSAWASASRPERSDS